MILCILKQNASKEIFVNSENGVLNPTCWDGGSALPCKTVNVALEGAQMENYTTVTLQKVNGPYYLSPGSSTTIRWVRGLKIKGERSIPSIVVSCLPEAGLEFIYSQEISIVNSTLSGCGRLQNSTSKNAADDVFLKMHVGLYFLLCEDILMSGVTVTESHGIGVVIYATGGYNKILHSKFSCNPAENLTGGGGLYIEFVYCLPGDINCSVQPSNVSEEFRSNSQLYIYNTLFQENRAYGFNPVKSPKKNSHYSFGKGGGLSAFYKGNSYNNTIVIQESAFYNNSALWGGGLYVEFDDLASNSKMEIISSTFDENKCISETVVTEGGGMKVGFVFYGDAHVTRNKVTCAYCVFTKNKAHIGGGVSFYTVREQGVLLATNTLEFHFCNWTSNVARLGSALDLSLWHRVNQGAIVQPTFIECVFQDNTARGTVDIGVPVGLGAMYLESISVMFGGRYNEFVNNKHSAMVAVDSAIYVNENTTINFTGNTGYNGGALSLLGYAFIQTSDNTILIFHNNSAEVSGRSIYGQTIGLVASQNCHIRFSDVDISPYNWTSEFHFSNNHANGQTNSIFVSSLLTCVEVDNFISTTFNYSDVFCWSERWDYVNSSCNDEISTSPAKFDHGHIT